MRDRALTERAKAMRREATPPERAVWQVLRAPPFATLYFRRQVAFDNRYIADFASHRERLIVEVDGRSHDNVEAADERRTRWFEAQGYRIVRVTNAQALDRDQDLGVLLATLIGK